MSGIIAGMRPYAQDLRDRIIQALEAGSATPRAIATRFGVSGVFVEKLWQRWRRPGSRSPKPHAGGRQGALNDQRALLAYAVGQQPDATLAALRDRLVAAQGPRGSTATVCRALPRLKLPIKNRRSTPRSVRPSGS